MVLNLEQLPSPIKEDVEVQSLHLLRLIREQVVVIGGWGVRAWTSRVAIRNTLDVDAVAEPEDLGAISRRLESHGLEGVMEADWGVRFHARYVPSSAEAIDAIGRLGETFEDLQLRIEVSQPRIHEKRTPHYFQFHPERAVSKPISSREGSASVKCRIAGIHELAANKVGLPADYRNIFDLALLLDRCELEQVVRVITSTDDWRGMALRRIPRIVGRVQRVDNTANILLRSFGVAIDDFIASVENIREALG